uniref:Oxysterol-binding protein family n=1 Tax=Kwoniella pini CBS 10737 TaxID=1296096 RepID=A0A1B9I3U8_9TREE|nr:oxysterol-binding protein family [Kwoniella pini CBS 10737]OCF50190.1 oxysterol-binding protein family [Kwoniella pini CBS 10737]
MGLLSQGIDSLSLKSSKSRRASSASALSSTSNHGQGHSETQIDDGDPDDTSTLDKEEGNVLMALISQLRPGMDLTKIALPTFVLEPRSLLERITDFFSHPELIFGAGAEPDAKERFLRVMTYYLSGWHIKPKGTDKSHRYNPVLGEFFRCSYTYPDGTEGFYVAEQVSHHPPVSAFFYISPKNGLLVTGELKPKSKFLGNSAATIMEGEDRIRLLDRPEDGDYVITMPNTYARGILFGKMLLELCELSTVDCQATEYHADVDFKAKGWISGGYNVISGKVTGPGRTDIGDLSGHWSSAMDFTDKKTKEKRTVFDPSRAKVVPKNVLPESEQEEYESRRLWAKLTDAIKTADMHGATAAKTTVEDRQRELAKKREASGEVPDSRFFKHVSGDRWMPKLDVDNLPKDRQEMEDKVRQWIFGDKSPKTSSGSTVTSPNAPTSRKSSVPESFHSSTSSVPSSPTTTTATKSTPPTSATAAVGDTASIASADTTGTATSVPAVTTAPGPPATGPKFDHPV